MYAIHLVDRPPPFIEQQMSPVDAADGDGASIVCLGIGCSADVVAKMSKHLLSKSGTVRTVCQAVSAVVILIPHKLQGIVQPDTAAVVLRNCLRSPEKRNSDFRSQLFVLHSGTLCQLCFSALTLPLV